MNTGFLKRLNPLLANGEVPGLFQGDDYNTLLTQIREGAQRQDTNEELYRWFTQHKFVNDKCYLLNLFSRRQKFMPCNFVFKSIFVKVKSILLIYKKIEIVKFGWVDLLHNFLLPKSYFPENNRIELKIHT